MYVHVSACNAYNAYNVFNTSNTLNAEAIKAFNTQNNETYNAYNAQSHNAHLNRENNAYNPNIHQIYNLYHDVCHIQRNELKKIALSIVSEHTKKYGDIDGKVKYDIKRKKCGITLSKMIEKYGKNDGEIRYKRWLDSVTNGRNNIGVSNSSQELFWSVYEKLNTDLKNAVYFHELNEEYKHSVEFKLNPNVKIIKSL
jgi:hypothetical protein